MITYIEFRDAKGDMTEDRYAHIIQGACARSQPLDKGKTNCGLPYRGDRLVNGHIVPTCPKCHAKQWPGTIPKWLYIQRLETLARKLAAGEPTSGALRLLKKHLPAN